MPDAHNQKANARLIAAAPDLLQACIACADTLAALDCGPAWEQARAAITKAVGESHPTT